MGEPDIFIKTVLVLGKDEIQVIIEFLFNSCFLRGRAVPNTEIYSLRFKQVK